MERRLLDYTDIINIAVDETSKIGLITIRELRFLDSTKIKDIKIRARGVEFTQYATVPEMITAAVTENVYSFDDLGHIVFAVSEETVATMCAASDYIMGLEIKYPIVKVQYVTNNENIVYDVKAKLSNSGNVIYLGKHLSLNEVGNLMKSLDNKIDVEYFGNNIYEISRSLEVIK